MITKYEYKVIQWQISGITAIQKQLNDAGLRGWKVVGTGGGGTGDSYNGQREYQCWAILMKEK